MRFNCKGLKGRAFLWLSLGNAVCYALFHISYLLSASADAGLQRLSLGIEVVRVYISEAWELLLPALIAVLSTLAYTYLGTGRAIGLAAVASLSRLFFCLPYYYMYFVALGYESIEAIPLALIVTVGITAATLSASLLLFALGLLAARLYTGSPLGELRRALADSACEQSLLRPTPMAAATLAVAVAEGAVALVGAIIDTVEFFAEYGLGFTAGELGLILVDLCLPLVYTAAIYVICSLVRSRTARRRLLPQDAEEGDTNE